MSSGYSNWYRYRQHYTSLNHSSLQKLRSAGRADGSIVKYRHIHKSRGGANILFIDMTLMPCNVLLMIRVQNVLRRRSCPESIQAISVMNTSLFTEEFVAPATCLKEALWKTAKILDHPLQIKIGREALWETLNR